MSRERERDGAGKRNGLIECLRLLFTFFVLMLHSRYVSHGDEAMFRGGWIGVEFFFILSGYLMAQGESILTSNTGTDDLTSVGRDTLLFIRKKIGRLMPYYTFALVVNFVVWSIPFGGFSRRYFERAISGILNYLFAYSAGFKNTDFYYLGYSWYVSAMVLTMLILFPLLRKNRTMFNCVYAPAITIFGMGLFAYKYGVLGYVDSKDWLLSNGILRASFSISLGCLSYLLSNKLKEYEFTKFGSSLLSCVLIAGIGISSYRVIFLEGAIINDFLIIFLFGAIVAIAFSDKCSISFHIGKNVSSFVGNFSYALYICSNCWSSFISRLFPDWSYRKAVIVYMLLAVLCALLCMLVCGLIAKLWKKNKGKIIGSIIVQ